MKLDSESAYHHSFSSHEHDTKVILHNDNPFILTKDNHFMINMLNIENEAQNEGKHGTITSAIEGKNSKLMDSPTQYFYEEEDPLNSNKGDRECMEALYCAPTSGIGRVVKEDFYTDGNVYKIKSPEMRVCIDVDPHIVEDVSIDEGVQSFEKTMVEKEKLAEAKSSMFSQSMEYKCDDMTEEMEVSGSSDDLNHALFNRDEIYIVEKAIAEMASVHNDFDGKGSYGCNIDRGGDLNTAESMESNLSSDTTENIADAGSFVHNNFHENKSSLSSTVSGGRLDSSELVISNISAKDTEIRLLSEEISTQHLQGDSSNLVFSTGLIQPVDGQTIQGKEEQTNFGSTALLFPPEVSELSNESKEVTSNCRVPSGVITFKFDNQAASSSGREENEESRENQQSEIAQSSLGIEEAKTDGATAAARPSFLHVIQEESNFSGPALLSDPIGNSGHIPYSGSISLRSDSSATSARSFAFPVLQSEWNSSPVKMAKADRRHLRKRGWRMGRLCCRF